MATPVTFHPKDDGGGLKECMSQRPRKTHWFELYFRDPRSPTLCHTVRLGPLPPLVTTVGNQVSCRACRFLLALPLEPT